MFKKLAILIIVLLLLAGVGLWWIISSGGFSARQQPTALEAALARTARGMAIPSSAKETKNPVPLTQELMQEARRHFASEDAQELGLCSKARNGFGVIARARAQSFFDER